MKQFTGALFVLSVAVLVVLSCTKSSPIGSDLVEDDQAEVFFTDTIAISAKTIRSDSIVVYSPQRQLGNYLWGRYNDPFFGVVEAGIYSQLSLDETDDPEFFGDQGVSLDSLVLSLAYDTTRIYGNIRSLPQHMQVFQVLEDMERGQTYYSNRQFPVDQVSAGDYMFYPNTRDSITVIGYRGPRPDTTLLIPHLRVPLKMEFAKALAELDSTQYETVDLFRSHFKGIFLKAASLSEAILSFDMLSDLTRLTLYYKKTNNQGEDVPMEYNFPFTFQSVKTEYYRHDYSGSPIESFIDNAQKGDSLLFVQGMTGVHTQLEFPNIKQLKNVIINKAILEFTVADDDTTFQPIQRLVLSYKDSDGDLVLLDDVNFAVRQQALNLFGGQPKKNSNFAKMQYEMNIAAHLQDVVDGVRPEPLILIPLSRVDIDEAASRTVLFGPGHSTYPARLRVTYTQL